MSDAPRAVVFVDGNNWFHSLEDFGIEHRLDLDYAKISKKIITASRTWVATRYYIGIVPQDYSGELYNDQQRFLSRLANTAPAISVHRGRLEPRHPKIPGSVDIRQYLTGVKDEIPKAIWNELMDLALRCNEATVLVEKAVDVQLAIDMVRLALANVYDHAYLLSADGDFTPAVEAVMSLKKQVYPVSLDQGAALWQAAGRFLRLEPAWFSDCYRDAPQRPDKPHHQHRPSQGSLPVEVVVKKPRRRPNSN